MKNLITLGIGLILVLVAGSCNRKKDEKFCPEVHFTAGKSWTGEPTGLLYYEGEYHLFFQYNPSQAVLGNIHWGHAVSRDLIHWKQLPVAISPDSCGQIYSGSVVADVQNTSGLGSGENPPLIAFYTYHRSIQENDKTNQEHAVMSAYSLDKGRTWTKRKYPVLKNNDTPVFCNPKISWNSISSQWLMTVSTGTTIRFYSSSDCLQWSYMSEFSSALSTEGEWETSDLFPLKTADDITKWVLLVSMNGGPAEGAPAIRYFVGDFDGSTFKMTQTQQLWVDYGKDNYAGMTFNGMPGDRRVMLGWMNCWDYANLTPTTKWRGNMIFPRELSLVQEGKYYLLTSAPAKEIESIYGKTDSIGEVKCSDKTPIFSQKPFPEGAFILRSLFDNSNRYAIWGARDYGVRFKTASGRFISVGYNVELNYFYVDRSNLSRKLFSKTFEQKVGAAYVFNNPTADWEILVDHNSVELFACGNRIAITSLCFPDEAFDSFELYSESGSTKLLSASITELKK